MAKENGIRTVIVVGPGPEDKRTCPVCKYFVGQEFEVGPALAKIEKDIGIQDPEEYVAAWRFPRINDVDNISREELTNKGYFPPYHCRCRHSLAYGRK